MMESDKKRKNWTTDEAGTSNSIPPEGEVATGLPPAVPPPPPLVTESDEQKTKR